MFGKTTDDIAEALMRMEDEARIACRHDQYAMAHKMASFMDSDRRFDHVKNKAEFAKTVMDCRRSGRQLDLTERMKTGATSSPGYVAKSF